MDSCLFHPFPVLFKAERFYQAMGSSLQLEPQLSSSRGNAPGAMCLEAVKPMTFAEQVGTTGLHHILLVDTVTIFMMHYYSLLI